MFGLWLSSWNDVQCVYSVCVAGPVSTDQVILATGGYDHTIKFWAAHTGVCTRTLQHPDSQVSQTCSKIRHQIYTLDLRWTKALRTGDADVFCSR